MTHIIVCCDGLDPTYLRNVDTPGWDTIRDEGNAGTCQCAIPSLTNVNNISITTGKKPNKHGITGNTYYDRSQDERIYMEDPSYVRCRTQFQKKTAAGKQVGVLVAKDKLRRMIGQECTITASAENPPTWIEDTVGPAPDIYSGEASAWLMKAATFILAECNLDWLYVSTTDVVPHKYAPSDDTAKRWVTAIDEGIATLHAQADDIVVTADHGMSQKSICIDIEKLLLQREYDTTVIRLIRDKHTYHHQNLGGAAYVYADDPTDEVKETLATIDEIDVVLTATQAEERFDLPSDRIGDIMLLGSQKTVFGPVDDGVREQVNVRSHGSHHEQKVPYAVTRDVELDSNFDVISALQ
jgi:phosphonoacetate hydrolase